MKTFRHLPPELTYDPEKLRDMYNEAVDTIERYEDRLSTIDQLYDALVDEYAEMRGYKGGLPFASPEDAEAEEAAANDEEINFGIVFRLKCLRQDQNVTLLRMKRQEHDILLLTSLLVKNGICLPKDIIGRYIRCEEDSCYDYDCYE